MNRSIKLCADTATGITECDAFESSEVYNFHDFKKALPRVKDGEVICCEVTLEEYDILDQEYGISVLPGDIRRRDCLDIAARYNKKHY